MLRLPPDVALADIPRDWTMPAIGTPADVRAWLEQAFPGQDHADGQTCVVGDGFWIEFNCGLADECGQVESIGVRSNAAPGAVAVMKVACEVLELRLVDCQTSEIADFSDQTEASMAEFTAWRDRIVLTTDEQDAGSCWMGGLD